MRKAGVFMEATVIFWAVLFVAFLVIEFATAGLTSIWFALGSVGALISAAVAPSIHMIWLQVIIFLSISGVTMYFTRPLVKKYIKVEETATNASRVLAMTGVVREEINNKEATGVVFVGGKLWTARTETQETVLAGTEVSILRIEGVKLIVQAVQAEEKQEETAAEMLAE